MKHYYPNTQNTQTVKDGLNIVKKTTYLRKVNSKGVYYICKITVKNKYVNGACEEKPHCKFSRINNLLTKELKNKVKELNFWFNLNESKKPLENYFQIDDHQELL